MTAVRTDNGPDAPMVVPLAGEIDVASAPALQRTLAAARADGTGDIDVDVTNLRFIDCAGLGVLAEVARSLREQDRRLRLRGANHRLASLLRLVDLSELLS